ncbi:MAG TPA: class III extradiol ring-cleavage dioxygenase [Moraxellaceae bacterium]|nr:class III extradiol ring-cleavage dioxygenase [Moraxellaceae bacterium]
MRFPTFFISHGGGPWPWMMDDWRGAYDMLAAALRRLPADAGATPTAVLMISAHWEEPQFTVQSNPAPGMIYDYGGFPDYTYRISYPAPGAPSLSQRVQELLKGAGIAIVDDPQRGFDHGMYAPMAVIYPQAAMPTVQLSLKRGLDPETHLALGRALAPLRDEGVLIIGSGLSYHNLRIFGPAAKQPSADFDGWLGETLGRTGVARSAALTGWETAPSARQAHPREEHLLPLMVAVGAAEEEPSLRVYHESNFFGGISVSNWRFGTPAQ